MLIPGNSLPVLSNQTGLSPQPDSVRQGRQALDRHRETEPQNRQQTAEYVFRGELLDDVVSEHQNRPINHQQIDPANRTAISSYLDTDSVSLHQPVRQGRLVDIFI